MTRVYMHCIDVDICVSKVWRWHCIHNHKYSVCHLKSQTFTNVCIYLVCRRLLMQSLLKLKMQWVNNQKPNDSRDSAHLSAQNALVFVYRLHLSKANTFFRKYTCFSLSHSLWLRISCSPQSSYIADTRKHTHTHRIAPLLYMDKSVWDWSASTTECSPCSKYMFVQFVHR